MKFYSVVINGQSYLVRETETRLFYVPSETLTLPEGESVQFDPQAVREVKLLAVANAKAVIEALERKPAIIHSMN